MRAVLVMLVIATPTVLLAGAGAGADSQQIVVLVGLFMAALTFAEYNSVYPGLVEIRDAPPVNRIRFLMPFATVFGLSAIERGRVHPSPLSKLIHAVGALIGLSMDFRYSPVRLATLIMAGHAVDAQVGTVRTAAGMAYLISLVSLAIFVIIMRRGGWPRRDRAFSLWVNLPTFDPASCGDVVARLSSAARWNIAIGLLLPFLIPSTEDVASVGFQPLGLTSPQTLIWTMSAWAFPPARKFMRGTAIGRVAEMILVRIQASGTTENGGRYAPI